MCPLLPERLILNILMGMKLFSAQCQNEKITVKLNDLDRYRRQFHFLTERRPSASFISQPLLCRWKRQNWISDSPDDARHWSRLPASLSLSLCRTAMASTLYSTWFKPALCKTVSSKCPNQGTQLTLGALCPGCLRLGALEKEKFYVYKTFLFIMNSSCLAFYIMSKNFH